MPINVSEALDSDTGEIITVERTPSGAYVDGIYVDGGPKTTFKTICSVQQPTPKDLQRLSEGQRIVDLRKFISIKPLQMNDDKNNLIADVVLYESEHYEIIDAADWNVYGHTTAIGTRVK